MGAQRFFFFLPSPDSPLRLNQAISVLSRAGLAFDPTAFSNAIDDDGVLISSREITLNEPVERGLSELVLCEPCVQVVCADSAVLFTCTFGSPHSTPLFSVNVSRKRWLALEESVRDTYEQMLVGVANEIRAKNVLIIDDPADDFFGRLQAVERQWMVDTQLPDGTELDASTVLVNSDGGTCPSMRKLRATARHVGNFQEYRECLDA